MPSVYRKGYSEFRRTQCSQRKPRRSLPIYSLNPQLSNNVVSPMRRVQSQTRRTDERPELRLIDLQVSQNAVARPIDVQSHWTTWKVIASPSVYITWSDRCMGHTWSIRTTCRICIPNLTVTIDSSSEAISTIEYEVLSMEAPRRNLVLKFNSKASHAAFP